VPYTERQDVACGRVRDKRHHLVHLGEHTSAVRAECRTLDALAAHDRRDETTRGRLQDRYFALLVLPEHQGAIRTERPVDEARNARRQGERRCPVVDRVPDVIA
jgi:hypothetical protein